MSGIKILWQCAFYSKWEVYHIFQVATIRKTRRDAIRLMNTINHFYQSAANHTFHLFLPSYQS